MITPNEITTHLQTYLPIFSDLFTEFMTVASASVDASNIVTVNVTDHGKSVGDSVVISAGTNRNALEASLLVDDTVKFTTKYEHDLIMPSKNLDLSEITLAGFTGGDTVWNATFDIAGVPDRNSFIVSLPSGEIAAPTVDESQYLIEDRSAGLKGLQIIDTVPTDDQFTIALVGIPALPVGTIDNLSIISEFRIYAAADFKRAQAVYTKQASDDATLFVVMLDGDVSKDRHTLNDMIAGFTAQDYKLLRIARNFATILFLPTAADLSGAAAQQLAYGEIYDDLLRTLFGFTTTGQAINYAVVPSGDGPTEYNTAYYGHTYEWQSIKTIDFQNGFLQQQSVAFRDIAATFKLFADDQAEMTVNINLDEE
jgi:hypothetical protein